MPATNNKNTIVLQSNPRGCFIEGIISGTPLPGTVMELVPGVNFVNGRGTFRSSTRAVGKDRLALILQEDNLQGFPVGTAYVSGVRGFMYVPLPGEDVNVLTDVLGTGTGSGGGPTVGEYLEFNNNGHLTVETGSPQNTAFISNEKTQDVVLGYELVWVTKL